MINYRMYQRLIRIYEATDADGNRVETPHSVHDIERRAMVLKGTTRLTRGEKEACREVWQALGEKGLHYHKCKYCGRRYACTSQFCDDEEWFEQAYHIHPDYCSECQ